MRSLDTQLAFASVGRRLLREPRRPLAVRSSPHAHWLVVGTVCIGAFMGQLDASIVTLALPSIGRDLHASVGRSNGSRCLTCWCWWRPSPPSVGSRAGYADGVPLACLAVGVIGALAFIRRERRVQGR